MIQVVVEKNDSRFNEVFTFDNAYKAWMTYYYYRDRIGIGREWSKIIRNVTIF